MRHKAFTLIELLVVVTIISLLAAMLLPVISVVRDVAWETRCSANLRQCGIAALTWAHENDGALPRLVEPSGLTFDVHLIVDYGMVHNVYWCPNNKQAEAFTRNLDGVTVTGRRSYAIPAAYLSLPGDQAFADTLVAWYDLATGTRGSSNLGRVQDSSGSILYHERWDRPDHPAGPFAYRNMFGNEWGVSSSETWNIQDVHRGASNFLFIDGHVERRSVDSTLNGSQRGWTGSMSKGAWTIVAGD